MQLRQKSHVRKLIGQGEHRQLDFKFEVSDSRKIARTMSAFANTAGGILLIGVKDNGAIAGVRSDEELYMVDAAAKMYCKPEISFSTKIWKEDGKTVVEVGIPKIEGGIQYAQNYDGRWLAYVRSGDSNFLAGCVLLRIWKRRLAGKGTFVRYTEKEKILLQYLVDNDSISMSGFCRLAGITRRMGEKILVNMLMLGLVEMVFTDQAILYRQPA